MAHRFNISLTQGDVPTDRHQANVIPIFKKGKKFLARNCRPVSLTYICGIFKLFEHIAVSNNSNHLDEHQILVDCQHRFIAKRSCETQLLTLSHELLEHSN